MMKVFLTIWIGFVATAFAIVAPIPMPTHPAIKISDHTGLGLSPKPTTPPSKAELRRRQTGQNVLFVAPDATCGFEFGLSNAAISCSVGRTCAGYYNTNLEYNIMGCCGTTCGGFYTDCYNKAEVLTSSLCASSACRNDPEILLCTGDALPFCQEQSVPNGNMYLWLCANTQYNTFGQMRSTWDGQPSSGIWTTLNAAQASESFGVAAGVAPASLILRSSSSSSTSTSTTSSSSTTPSTTQPLPPSPRKKVPLGAIIGAAVGGVVVLAALGAGLFLCLRRKKSSVVPHQNAAADPSMVQYNTTPTHGGYGPGSPAPTYSGPVQPSHKAYDVKSTLPTVYGQSISGPSSPSPVYREQYSPPPAIAPIINSAPSPPTESRYQAYQSPSPPSQVVPGEQVYYPPPVERNTTSPVPGPAELGIRSPLPGTANGRPVYEAA